MRSKEKCACCLLSCLFAFLQICWTQKSDSLSKSSATIIHPTLNLGGGAEGGRPLCQPGVLNKSRSKGIAISYSFWDGGQIADSEDLRLQSIQAITVKARIPILLKPRLKVLIGYDYGQEVYDFRTGTQSGFGEVFQQFHRVRLKNQGLGLYGSYTFNHKFYLAIRAKALYQGDYTGFIPFEDRFANYQFGAIFGIKRNENEEIGIGFNLRHNFRNTLVLPFLIYNKTFNEHWGIETVLPASVLGRYNVKPGCILLFGARFRSRGYAAELDQGRVQYHVRNAAIQSMVSWEQKLVPWVWANVSAGYQVNLNTHYEAQVADLQTYELRQPNHFFMNVGFFISPPGR